MNFIALQIENLKKIKVFDWKFSPTGLIEIHGKNRQGKTTVLQAFEYLLRGKTSMPDDIVTHGEEEAVLVGELGDYKVTRKIKADGKTSLKIVNRDGLRIADSPQSFLDSLINELTFDPKPFIDKNPREKLRFMMDLMDLNFDALEEELKELEEERRYVGRIVKNFGDLKPMAEVEEVDILDLVAQKDKFTKITESYNRGMEKKRIYRQSIEDLKEKNQTIDERIKELEARKLNNLQEIKTHEETVFSIDSKLAKMNKPKKEQVEDLQNKIDSAAETNKQAKLYEENLKAMQAKEKQEDLYAEKTKEIEKLRNEKLETLKAADIPVKGLEIREDGIYYNETYSENWSQSESMKISFELAVAMNPKLRAIFIDNGESYDEESRKELSEWAINNNIQAFITVVDSVSGKSEDNVIYIEEGELI